MLDVRDIEYHVNEEKRVVVAIARGVAGDAIESISKAHRADCLMPCVQDLLIPDVMESKSHCHPADTWDEEIGKRRAREKLIRHYNKVKSRAIRDYLDKLDEFSNSAHAIEACIRRRSVLPSD